MAGSPDSAVLLREIRKIDKAAKKMMDGGGQDEEGSQKTGKKTRDGSKERDSVQQNSKQITGEVERRQEAQQKELAVLRSNYCELHKQNQLLLEKLKKTEEKQRRESMSSGGSEAEGEESEVPRENRRQRAGKRQAERNAIYYKNEMKRLQRKYEGGWRDDGGAVGRGRGGSKNWRGRGRGRNGRARGRGGKQDKGRFTIININ